MDKNILFILEQIPFDLNEYFVKCNITEIRLLSYHLTGEKARPPRRAEREAHDEKRQ